MTPQELEVRTLAAVETVLGGARWEDDLVELKRELPQPEKAARRLAAHANTAHGHVITWIVGIDEDSHTLVGPPSEDVAEWWGRVKSRFHGPPPHLVRHLVTTGNESLAAPVLAIAFETEEAPYMVPPSGPRTVQLEIPWREGTVTRTAKRAEVLRLLVPSVRVPAHELLSCVATLHEKPDRLEFSLRGRILLLPTRTDLTFLPAHTSSTSVAFLSGHAEPEICTFEGEAMAWAPRADELESPVVVPTPKGVLFAFAQRDGLYVSGPGSVSFDLWHENLTLDSDRSAISNVRVSLKLAVAGSDRALLVTADLVRVDDEANPAETHRFAVTPFA